MLHLGIHSPSALQCVGEQALLYGLTHILTRRNFLYTELLVIAMSMALPSYRVIATNQKYGRLLSILQIGILAVPLNGVLDFNGFVV